MTHGEPSDDAEDSSPTMPGDLPPLPSPFFRSRPPHLTCHHCGRHFPDAEELNQHARVAHKPTLDPA